MGKKDPLAVGVDGKTVNLNKLFLRALDAVDRKACNSLILLMDACLEDVDSSMDTTSQRAGHRRSQLGMNELAVEESKNLKVRSVLQLARKLVVLGYVSCTLVACGWSQPPYPHPCAEDETCLGCGVDPNSRPPLPPHLPPSRSIYGSLYRPTCVMCNNGGSASLHYPRYVVMHIFRSVTTFKKCSRGMITSATFIPRYSGT